MKNRKKILVFLFLGLSTTIFSVMGAKRNIFATEGVRLRSTPSITGASKATIPAGAEISILSVKPQEVSINSVTGQWLEVEYGGKRGFVFGGYTSSLPYPKNCSSVEKYLHSNFAKDGAEIRVGIKPDEQYAPNETGKKTQNFIGGIIYTEINSYEFWSEQIEMPNSSLYEVYFLVKACEKEFAALDFKTHRTQSGILMKKYRGSTSLRIEEIKKGLVRVTISRSS